MEQHELPTHPQAAEEFAFLQKTCDIVEEEIAKLERETGVGAWEDREVVVPDGISADETVAINLFRMKLDTLHQLARSRQQAYFARLDFAASNGGEQVYYLGRWGVMKTPEMELRVVDWRSPIANLYYSGQIGPMDYEAPDGRVTGELTLKRMLTVRGKQLEGIFDSGIVSQDAYLQGVLGAVTSDRLREIVTTIQAEQNLIIRHPLRESLIVQGVAGSGKTTIALHRIAYLLYVHRNNLAPEQMMILAPNPLFLSYISQVLPDLGVERVRQTTFAALCMQWLGKNAPKLERVRRTEDKLLMDVQAREALGQVLRRKGSLDMMRSLESYLDKLQTAVLPKGALTFGGMTLMSEETLREVFLRQLKPWPLVTRIQETKKVVKRYLDKACEAMREQLERMASNRLSTLLSAMPDCAERRARATRLLNSRDERLQEVSDKAKAYLRDFHKLFAPLSLLGIYRDYLLECESVPVQEATLPLLDKKHVQMEDLPALCAIARALYSLPKEKIRHIVIDECQDFSPWQIMLLRQQMSGASFTLVGDLAQGIHEDEGIRGYDEWLQPVFEGNVQVRQLVTSYRSTAEIMNAANGVLAHHPIAGQALAKPVLRHGEKPSLSVYQTDKERVNAIAKQAAAWQEEGFHTIALIEKTEAAARKLLKALPQTLDAHLLREDDADYAGGVLVLPAAMVKGLEFDCAMLCNVSDALFPDDAFLCRVLYVMMTRPLHRLAICAQGAPSPLLETVGVEMADAVKDEA